MNYNILTITNTVTIIVIVGFKIISPYLRKIKIERTFWEKKPYGIYIMKFEYDVDIIPNEGRSIFHFTWRNPDKISDDINKVKN